MKCDEKRPCSKCVRRHENCAYRSNSTEVGTEPASPSSLGARPRNGTVTEIADSNFNALDLFLVFRFSTATSVSLWPSLRAQKVWQTVLPVEALSHPLLRHGMLALAATDLACCADRPPTVTAPTCRARALFHQQIGLELFQEILQQNRPEERHATFLFSVILIIVAFASVHSSGSSRTLDEILDLFALFRGGATLWMLRQDLSNSELMHALFSDENVSEDHDSSETPCKDPFETLRCTKLDASSATALTLLDRCWNDSLRQPSDVRPVAHFPARVPIEFMQDAREREPVALQILAHYSRLLYRFRSYWWIVGWYRILLSAIQDVWPEHSTSTTAWEPSLLLNNLEP